MKKLGIAGLLLALAAGAAEFPQAEIASHFLKVKLYLPDMQRGYYRGSRFDWSGVISSLTYKGHEYFGVWFPHYDPLLHDAITGPVEEFRGDDGEIGYTEAKPGGMFVKIGVGVLRRPDDKEYSFARAYQIVNPGTRVVRPHADHVDFEHELKDGEGLAYIYRKTVRVSDKRPEMTIEHALKNTGKRTIDVSVYNHDFYMIDGQPTGPAIRVKFGFTPKAKEDWKGPADITGNEIVYQRELAEGETASGQVVGFKGAEEPIDIRVENSKTGAGVHETGDRPLAKIYFWSIRTTVCPEAYVKIHVEPGKSFKWRLVYEFYVTGTKAKETGDGT